MGHNSLSVYRFIVIQLTKKRFFCNSDVVAPRNLAFHMEAGSAACHLSLFSLTEMVFSIGMAYKP